MGLGRKCGYKEFAELIKVFRLSHMEKASIEQRLEVSGEVIKADSWLKNYPEKENSYCTGSHDSIDILINRENCSQKKIPALL